MGWNFEIKAFWTLQLKLQNNHTTLYISKKWCIFKWIWETIEHYAYTQIKVKEQRLYCCSTLRNHNFAVQCDKWIAMYQWIQLVRLCQVRSECKCTYIVYLWILNVSDILYDIFSQMVLNICSHQIWHDW